MKRGPFKDFLFVLFFEKLYNSWKAGKILESWLESWHRIKSMSWKDSEYSLLSTNHRPKIPLRSKTPPEWRWFNLIRSIFRTAGRQLRYEVTWVRTTWVRSDFGMNEVTWVRSDRQRWWTCGSVRGRYIVNFEWVLLLVYLYLYLASTATNSSGDI